MAYEPWIFLNLFCWRKPLMFIFGHAGLTLMGYQVLWRKRAGSPPIGMPQLTAILFFSLLPDLLDKPLTLWFFQEAVSTRWVGHTMAFSLMVCAAVYFFIPSLKKWVWACPGHLLLDGMWRSPHTLFFPILGWEMDPGSDPRISFWEFLTSSIHRVVSEPELVLPELLGLLVLLLALFRLKAFFPGRARVAQSLPRLQP
jgi:hypothetical protein